MKRRRLNLFAFFARYFDQQPAAAEQLQTRLRDWKQSVLNGLPGGDYRT